MEAGIQAKQITQWDSGRWEAASVTLIVEKPVTLTVNGSVWNTFLCTPIQLESLAIGFLYNEYFIDQMEDVLDTRVCPTGENIDVWTRRSISRPTTWRRTTDCTGGISSENQLETQPAVELCEARLCAGEIEPLMERLFATQGLYHKGGGLHSSALSDGQEILLFAEDIGQQNTLDKIAGMSMLQKCAPIQRVVLTTGRVTSEMVQKAIRMQASIVITRGSPSSLSVEIAETAGVTLVGHAHIDRFSVYSHPERILSSGG